MASTQSERGLRSGGFHELEARFADFFFLPGEERVRLLAEATAELHRGNVSTDSSDAIGEGAINTQRQERSFLNI